MDKYPKIIPMTLSYLEHCVVYDTERRQRLRRLRVKTFKGQCFVRHISVYMALVLVERQTEVHLLK